MKGLKLSIFSTLLCLTNVCAAQEEQKIYIQPDQARIDVNGIFVDLPQGSVGVSAIHSDGIGTYVVKSEYQLSRCPKGHYSRDGDGLCDYPGCPYNR